ncbi:glycosyltransferase, partial [Escherichia coli]|nr:glycosyltransferase [Escherichia coli]
MDQQPTLTVVIPCYRSGVGLTWQLESLIHQRSAPRREILLCDNGANPGLADRVRDLGILPNDVTIRVIDATDHRGAAYARNRGIAEAQAD